MRPCDEADNTRIGLIDESQLTTIASDDCQCAKLRPIALRSCFNDGVTNVLRPSESDLSNAGPTHFGKSGLADALVDFGIPLLNASQRRFDQKTVHIQSAGDVITTRHYVEYSGTTPDGTVEQHATWRCQWDYAGDGAPRLSSIIVEDYEETVSKVSTTTWFRDCTHSVIGATPAYQKQLAHGLNHWLARVETSFGMYVFAEYGIALGDVNGDGLEDILLCQPGGLPNRLLVQNPDGTVSDRTSQAGVGWLDHTSSALLVDLDNDRDQDLYVANDYGQNCLYRNTGQGFEEVAVSSGVVDHGSGMSVSWADYDRDGWMDLYVGNMFSSAGKRVTSQSNFWQQTNPTSRAILARFAKGNTLFRNTGNRADLEFDDVGAQAAVGIGRWAWSSIFTDLNNDGGDDLLVVNGYITTEDDGDL